jgi:hypothetical protein
MVVDSKVDLATTFTPLQRAFDKLMFFHDTFFDDYLTI